MELQQMRYVVAVAEERNFTRAAQRCHVVQSALSHQIKALERELGVPLFVRNSRRVELTSAGEQFVASARASLSAAERAVADATGVSGELRGELRLGLIPTVNALNVPATLGDFHRKHPAVSIKLVSGSSDNFMAAIAEGHLDLAVLGLPESVTPRGVQTTALAREALVAVLSAEHRLAPQPRVSLEELARESLVDFPGGTTGRSQTDIAFERAGLTRTVVFEAMTTPLILDLVRHGLAVAILPGSVVPDDPQLVCLPIGKGGPVRVEYLAWRSFNPSPAARVFLEMLVPHKDI
ncbi:LysR family transcriptional regulator [Glutamicibacter sp. PS]|uniref:LysR family transcriptional regulator n=1 Tax=Glutamicibacter sp. PS TaxID=3075634 RepID=UPI002851A0B5|nr:LysR family transcriptional regulator [Glutamicibacter sp. PS]MDR4534217.1 LysR family transcriptional regulator [Glutamicibacter sp. PS]